jgi:phospholipid/cholesterol/gamma-HCH transport system permease protein
MTLKPKSIQITQNQKCVDFTLSGDWVLRMESGVVQEKWRDFISPKTVPFEMCSFQIDSKSKWDSSLLVFLLKARKELSEKNLAVDFSSLPEKIQNLLNFAQDRSTNRKNFENDMLDNESNSFDLFFLSLLQFSTFWGKWLWSVAQLLQGRSYMRFTDFFVACRDCGASALPIVTLIAFLTGLTMAFVGSVQLEKFNATIYVADLVSLAMVREMGALMVAIVMAGRTGASFAAELGSMKLREEIDSLRTFGIPAMDFLVLPRTLALFFMTPLLTLYADVVGILGGLTVGTQVMDFSSLHYFEQTQSALTNMWEVYSGLIKSLAFGLIIGLVGCYKGMFTGNNSTSLGKSVTSSVVISITLIVICDACFEIFFSFMGYR